MNFRKDAVTVDLSGEWQFAFADDEPPCNRISIAALQAVGLTFYPATVPGNFELDLHRNALLPDPFFAKNIAALPLLEDKRIWYAHRFDAPPVPDDHEAFLVFEGLDCFADILWNGQWHGAVANMLIPHHIRVEVQEENELIVAFRPVSEEAAVKTYPPLLYTQANRYESLHVRKAPHMYGWDIMPRALSAGVWRPVKLVYLPRERLDSLYLETLEISADRRRARLVLHYGALLADACQAETLYEIEVEGWSGDSIFHQRQRMLFPAGRAYLEIAHPKLWWPRGRGDANLYNVFVRLYKNGVEVDRITFTHGIRTVALDRTSVTDERGAGEFVFRVNGEKVFIHGSNWVPVDAFHSRDRERLPKILAMAVDLNCNMLRCWGGNVYEDDLFYELCDREGILIWQDFAMACAVYPQDDAFQQVLTEEARAVVRRLRQHACLALWAGDNECDESWSWGGRRQDPNANVLTRKVLPAVLRDEDPGRPYLPSSPYMDDAAFAAGDKYLPENHLWGPRDYFKSRYYTESLCHFASEIGYHGCPSRVTLEKFLSPEKLWPYQNNDEWILHSTSPIPGVDLYDYRVELMANQIRELFGVVPDNLDDFALASQISQAEAKKFFIELFRAGKWRRTGILWWNLMDGWPQMSDAIVDYYFEKKLAYGYVKRAQQPLILALREPQNWAQELVACSDRRKDVALRFTVRDVDTDETLLAGDGLARADAVTTLGSLPFSASAKRLYRIEWKGEDVAGFSHYLAGYPPFSLDDYRRWAGKAGLFPPEAAPG